jgi:hypothetical protein
MLTSESVIDNDGLSRYLIANHAQNMPAGPKNRGVLEALLKEKEFHKVRVDELMKYSSLPTTYNKGIV